MTFRQSKLVFGLLASLIGLIGLSQTPMVAQSSAQEMPAGGAPVGKTSPEVDPSFPQSVRDIVLQTVAKQTGLQPEKFIITQASPKIWSDGCLGLGPPDQMCTAVLVRGWEVRVRHQREEWVYRTNSSGEAIMLDPAGSRLGQMIPPPAEPIPPNQRPPRLDKNAVFRAIKTGGFAGITQETTLYKDGRLVRKEGSAGAGQVLRTLSKTELKAFKKQLEKLHFGQFDGLYYGAPKGAADYFTITFSDRRTTVQYADLNLEATPQDLQSVAKAWQSLLTKP